MPIIPKAKLVSQVAELQVENPGISYTEKHSRSQEIKKYIFLCARYFKTYC